MSTQDIIKTPRLYELLRAIYHNQPIVVKDLCSILKYDPKIFNRRLEDPLCEIEELYKGYNCLDIFYKLLNTSKDKHVVDDSIVDIFHILVSHGMKWEEVIMGQYYGVYPINFVYTVGEDGYIDFLMNILVMIKFSHNYLNNFTSTEYRFNKNIKEYIDNCNADRLEKRLKNLTPETKGLILSAYIIQKEFINYTSEFITSIIDITKLLVLRNIGDIYWPVDTLIKYYYISLEKIYNAANRYQSNSEIVAYTLNNRLTVLTILASAGCNLLGQGKPILKKFLLDRPNLWLLKRERTLELPLPIPLEAKLSLWEAGNMGGIFDRLQLSMLMR